jgi:hypothetical protein
MAEVVECSLDACVAPARMLASHSDDQVSDDLHYSRPARGSRLVGPLLSNELPVPAKDGVWSDERSDLRKRAPSNGLATDGQSASLVVGQPEAPAAELLLENPVLFTEILDDCVLLAADPARQRGHEDLPGLKDGGYPLIVAR